MDFQNTYIKWWQAATIAALVGCTPGVTNPSNEAEDTKTFTIEAGKPVAEIQPTMYGIFFEDINFAADGGIYAEMVKNRSFEFYDPMTGWSQPKSDRFSLNENSGFAAVVRRGTFFSKISYLNVKVHNDTGYHLINEGFKGMGVKEGLRYDFSMKARLKEGNTRLQIALVDSLGNSLGGTKISLTGGDTWTDYETSFVASKTEMKANLKISFEGKGEVSMDMVSLFPSDTWKNRPKGMRGDLVQLLADLNPGFLRFPGGCIVEGRNLDERYQWKKTVGNIEDRDVMINRWNTEFSHRPAPDYFQSFGLGFFEYFQLAEDLGAEPLPILSCGIACQFNTGELVPMDELGPYIDDALHLIEFANGPVTSPWGKIRADMGHPEPFDMKYIGIGNEQWGPEYIKRHIVFEAAIKEKYPDMIIVAGSGPYPDGEMFDFGMQELKRLNAEIIDEHYYRSPQWFFENADRYDSYDREGPKIFAGEYAAQSVAIASPNNKNNWECALAEAAFMTGLERNAEVVHLTSYAPLMAHAEGWQWTPDLIWFNNLQAYATPNYHVQKLFATNRGSHVLQLHSDGKPSSGAQRLYATAAFDEKSSEIILKIVNANGQPKNMSFDLRDAALANKEGTITVLKADNLQGENSFDSPENIQPQTNAFSVNSNQFSVPLAAQSLSIVRIATSKSNL